MEKQTKKLRPDHTRFVYNFQGQKTSEFKEFSEEICRTTMDSANEFLLSGETAATSLYVCFDIDNCLAEDGWRLPLIKAEETDPDARYEDYHRASNGDFPNAAAFSLLKEICKLPVGLAFVTARPEKFRDETEHWLTRHLRLEAIQKQFVVLMRKNGDHRAAPQVKLGAMERFFFAGGRARKAIAFVDDRVDILDAMQASGVPVTVHFAAEQRSEAIIKLTVNPGELGSEFLAEEVTGDVELQEHLARSQVEKLSLADFPSHFSGPDAADLLNEAAETFRERQSVYRSNYRMVGPIMKILFPEGVSPELLGSDAFHLFELCVVKLSRLAISNLSHQDSARDLAVYSAMIESIVLENQRDRKN